MSFNPTSLFDIYIFKDENDEYGIDVAPAKEMLKFCTQRLDTDLSTNNLTNREDIVNAITTYMIEFAEGKLSKN